MKRVNIKCPYCGSQAHLRPAAVVYGDHTEDPTAKVYVCAHYPACDSYVAAHRATLLPMGTLANQTLRRKRMEAHTAFNQLWEEGYMSKKAAYRWLQVQMGLPESEAHIAKFSELRCQQVIGLCQQFIRPMPGRPDGPCHTKEGIDMKWKQPLTEEQRMLAEQNLRLVRWTVREYINVREEIEGLGLEDLCQEGAIALCHAAATYQAGSVQFKTYAVPVIRNHLLDHCRRVMARQRNMPTVSLDAPLDEDKPPSQIPFAPDVTEEWISELYVSRLLEHGKRTYSGVAKLGIEALELKIKGYSGADIAKLYHTKPNHVGAWISRAAEKLRSDAVVMGLLGMDVENVPPHS